MDIPATLQAIIAQLDQERGSLQIVGRPLTPQEEQRVKALDQAIEHLRSALVLLTNETPTKPDFPGLGARG